MMFTAAKARPVGGVFKKTQRLKRPRASLRGPSGTAPVALTGKLGAGARCCRRRVRSPALMSGSVAARRVGAVPGAAVPGAGEPLRFAPPRGGCL